VKRRKEKSYRTILRKRELFWEHTVCYKKKEKGVKDQRRGTALPELESFYPSRRK